MNIEFRYGAHNFRNVLGLEITLTGFFDYADELKALGAQVIRRVLELETLS